MLQAMRQASPRAKDHGSRTPRTRSPSRSPAIVITEGQDVEILDPETGVYARALVVTILPTGDLDVHMADGSTRSCVDLNLVRPIASASPPRPHRASISKETPTPSKQEAPKPTPSEVAPETAATAPAIPWAVGTRVEARYRGGEEWRAAVVDGVDVGHNTADVTYEHDGSKDWKVRAENLREAGPAPEPPAAPIVEEEEPWKEGCRVEGNYKGYGRWFKGHVTAKDLEGWEVTYDDGEVEHDVPSACLRMLGEGTAEQPVQVASDLEVGARVTADQRGKGQWLPGHVSRVHADGGVDVEYDDGSVERHVTRDKVQKVEQAPQGSPQGSPREGRGLVEGSRVEVDGQGQGEWAPATVSKVHDDGSMDVVFEGGEVAPRVAESRVRPVGPVWAVENGSKVEIDLDVGSALRLVLTGKVAKLDRFNGTCDVVFANKLRKERVPLASLKQPIAAAAGGPIVEGEKFNAGQAIERRLGQHWLRGRILQKHAAGDEQGEGDDRASNKYDVEYCGVEAGVPCAELRRHDGPSFNVDDGVLVRFHNGHATRYVPATVQRVDRHSGLVDVRYADGGQVETNVHASILQEAVPSLSLNKTGLTSVPLAPGASESKGSWSVGQRIEARYRHGPRWFPGRVSLIHGDGSVDVAYDDGDAEDHVSPDNVRPLVPVAESSAAIGGMQAGTRVEARFREGPQWYPGVARAVYDDGSVDVEYDDGDREAHVSPDRVRPLGGAGGGSMSGHESELEVEKVEYKAGDRVVARFRDGQQWFAGKVTHVHEDGHVDVEYDDGDKEERVAPDHVRPFADATGASVAEAESGPVDGPAEEPAVEYKAGDRIVARFHDGPQWFAGKVANVHEDGHVDVEYDDGDKEERVARHHVRRFSTALGPSMAEPVAGSVAEAVSGPVAEAASGPVDGPKSGKESEAVAEKVEYKVGDRVVARFRDGPHWFAGKVTHVHEDGHIDVEYDDGDKEERIVADNVRPFADAVGPAAAEAEDEPVVEYKVGDRIVARFRNGPQWFAGKVAHVHDDGHVDVEYDDGDKEERVVAENVRLFTDAVGPAAAEAETVVAEKVEYKAGDRIVARFRDGPQWFAGKVANVHEDGHVDVEYDDGDKEERVVADNVRLFTDAVSPAAAEPVAEAVSGPTDGPVGAEVVAVFKVGDRVVARFRDGPQWYAGKVAHAHEDGHVDVEYDDGDKEERVMLDHVRRFSTALGPLSLEAEIALGGSYSVGDKVEARFKGGSAYFPGTIASVNEGGTYDVRYEDGDEETAVPAEFIQKLEPQVLAPSEGYKVGDRIEARFGGLSRWFSGVVSGVHGDGSVDVAYDDGDREEHVSSNLLRPLNPPPTPVGPVSAARANGRFAEGEAVEARFRGKPKFIRGKISAVNDDGSYDVEFDSGDEECAIPADHVRPLPGAPPLTPPEAFAVNDKVEARFRSRSKWFAGKVTAVHADGSVDVAYEDGDNETHVAPTLVRRLSQATTAAPAETPATAAPPHRASLEPPPEPSPLSSELGMGDRVEGRLHSNDGWVRGSLISMDSNNTFDVRFENREWMHRVPPADLRRPLPAIVGQRVEALRPGSGKYEAATVLSASTAYTLLFGEGAAAEAVDVQDMDVRIVFDQPAGQQQQATAPAPTPTIPATAAAFKAGDKVEAQFRGGKKWFPALVSKLNGDGSYDVTFDDGDRDPNVPLQGLRAVPAPVEAEKAEEGVKEAPMHEHGVGDKVETRYRGGKKWFGAVITAVHEDRKVDVRYHDGELEDGVLPEHIRLPGDHQGASAAGEEEAEHSHEFTVNQRVEVRPRGSGGARSNKWVPARVIASHHHGSYDVRVEASHEVESDVHAEWLRPLPGTFHDHHARSGSLVRVALEATAEAYRPGDRVEGFSVSGGAWAPGMVTEVHHHGTVDLMYEDGRVEHNVSPDHVRRPRSPEEVEADGDAVVGPSRYSAGGRVDVCVDGANWFPALVQQVNADGTYHVRLNDGTQEPSLPGAKLRSRRSSVFAAAEAKLLQQRRAEDGKPPQSAWAEPATSAAPAPVAPQADAPVARGSVSAPASAPESAPESAPVARGSVSAPVSASASSASTPERRPSASVPQPSPQRRQSQPSRRASNGAKRPSNGRVPDHSDSRNGRRPSSNAANGPYKPGDRVQGRQRGGKAWVDGRIVGVNTEASEPGYVSYEVRYEGGERENHVDAVLLRLAPEVEEAVVSEQYWEEGMFHVGEAVEARLQGGSEWLPGTISRIAPDRLYEILYKTGHKENGVEGFLVRYPLAVGTRVEAHFRSGKKWFPAVITAVHEEGASFDVLYDDGDSDAGVRACDVRRPGDESQPSAGGECFASGDKVEVRYQGLSDWLPGVVACANADGTYSVEFENFMAEAAVRPEHIRRPLPAGETGEGAEGSITVAEYYVEQTAAATLGASGSSHGRRGSRQMGLTGTAIQEKLVLGPGHRVEARFRKGKKWFGGRILAVNRDGSCDVRYVDGDVERGVDPALIRFPLADDAPGNKPAVLPRGMCTYELGEKILARFPFALDYLPGKVIAVHRDGTYDVRFEDGGKDSHVHPKYIKRRKASPKMPAPHRRAEPRFLVAQQLEARAPGSVDWRPALVTAVLEEGQYAIKYQDQGPSSGSGLVATHNLLRDMNAGEGLRAQSFEVGQLVEALYALGDVYFVAKVVGVREEGTCYDLRYSDGDLETGVGAEFMRPLVEVERDEPEYDINDHLAVRVGEEWLPAKVRRVNQTHDGKFCYDVVTLSGTRRMSRIPVEALRKLVEAEAARGRAASR